MRKYFYELMTDARHSPIDKIISGLLWILSLVYGVVVKVTRALYEIHVLSAYRSDKPVISVGNITTGGVGKTPLVIYLATALKQKGLKVAVLSRGYGSSDGVNDEVMMFRQLLPDVPVITGADRKKSIQKALAQGMVDIFIADDAFSHWPLKRDLDILAIDATNPFGNGQLLPRGVLREPLSALKRADIIVLTKTDHIRSSRELCGKIHQSNSTALILESSHLPQNFQEVFSSKILNLDELKDKKVVAFCAIGEPKSFEHSLKHLGVNLVKNFSFVDHHQYSDEDIKLIVDFARAEKVNILVTTHKDAVKITASQNLFKDLTVLRLNINLKIYQKQEEFLERAISLQRH